MQGLVRYGWVVNVRCGPVVSGRVWFYGDVVYGYVKWGQLLLCCVWYGCVFRAMNSYL